MGKQSSRVKKREKILLSYYSESLFYHESTEFHISVVFQLLLIKIPSLKSFC